jgi:ribose transport system permease protein
MENKTNQSTINLELLAKAAPLMGLALVVALFAVLTQGKIVEIANLNSLTNQVIVTALVGIGAVFVFGSGALDMSMSGSVCFVAIIGAKVALATGSVFYMLIACLAISLVLGLFKGLMAAYVEAPVFIVTIVLGGVLTAVGTLLLGNETVVNLTTIPSAQNMTWINIFTLGGFYLGSAILFNYTRIGKSIKLQGGNAVAAKQMGINLRRTTITAFLIGAFGIGLAAFIILLRTKTVSIFTGGTVGIDIMVATVLGGMPLSGGPRSKISAAIIGAATITFLNSGLAIMGLSTGTIQIFRGVVFLIVVLITSLSYRTQMLPR